MTGHCFWCVRVRPLTRDHVLPKACGGRDTDNIVMACRPCNHSRAKLVDFGILALAARDGRMTDRAVRRLWRGYAAIVTLQQRWVATETDKWGRSPSKNINLDLPPRPPKPKSPAKLSRQAKRIPQAVLQAARQAAEARFDVPQTPSADVG